MQCRRVGEIRVTRSDSGALSQAGVPAALLATTRALHEEEFSVVPFLPTVLFRFVFSIFLRGLLSHLRRNFILLRRDVFYLSPAEWVAVRAQLRAHSYLFILAGSSVA